MASVSFSPFSSRSFLSFHSSPPPISFMLYYRRPPPYRKQFCVSRAARRSVGEVGSVADAYGSNLLRKPAILPLAPANEFGGIFDRDEESEKKEDQWVDWEDRMLEDTVPLVAFVKTILHSGKYESGDRLSSQHERTVLERLLPYHPQSELKIGCGVDYVTVGYHPDFEVSRCLFIVRKDGQLVDFSYWKCIKGLIRKNYPLYADGFILRHFRKRRR